MVVSVDTGDVLAIVDDPAPVDPIHARADWTAAVDCQCTSDRMVFMARTYSHSPKLWGQAGIA